MDIQLTHHSLVIGYIECSHPDKYTNNSEYNILTGSISSTCTSKLAEGLFYEAAIVSEITTKEHHSKVVAKILSQIWKIKLGSSQQTLKTTTQVGVRHNVHPLTRLYKTGIIHGYNSSHISTTI